MQKLPAAEVTIGSQTILVEIASTESAREQGLSGRMGLSEGKGMLFIFSESGVYGFWMKDMRFAIDIVFIDERQKIISVEAQVAPETYPKTFYPPSPARYVLELPAGYTEARGIRPGMEVRFDTANAPR